MKIAIYIGQLDVGGAEGQIVLLARGLRARGHDVMLITEEGRTRAVTPDLLGSLVLIPHRPRRARLRALKEILAAARPDVLHCQLTTANLWGTVAGRRAGVPAIIISFLSTDPWKKWYHFLADRYAAGRADGIWCNSRRVADRYRAVLKRHAAKFRVIYNGVDTARFDPARLASARNAIRTDKLRLPADAAVVINVGNLRPVKNHALLLRALAEVHAGPGAAVRPHLVLVGDGPEQERIVGEAGRMGLLPFLRLLGPGRDVEKYLAAADVFALSSDAEGFSNALLEAMSSSLACVATDVGGNAEALADGAGVVTPPGDAAALAAALTEILADERRRRELGEAARRRAVEKFALARMVAETEAWYAELLGRKPTAP
ncbi:MAG TPA: glycosyltransferase [bacterium]|nr:glycosyltransferase [bacterium]